MAVEASSESNLLRGSKLGNDGRVTLKQPPAFEKNRGRSEVRKRALALDYSKSSHTSVKKSKLSAYDDEDDADDILDSLERKIEKYCTRELQNKKMKVGCIRKINEVYKKMQKKIADCVCDIVYNETLHGLMEDLIRERKLQLKTKEEELDAIKKLIDGQARELESERKKLDKVKSKSSDQMKEFELTNNRIKARIAELDSFEKQVGGRMQECNLKEEEFRRQVKEAKLNFGSQAKDLESKRKQLEGQIKEFELRKQKFESQVKEHELKERRERQHDVFVKSIIEENELDEPESLDKIIVDLKETSNPSEVVLDIIQKPIIPSFKDRDGAVIMDSHIFLLEQLLRISPPIKPDVRGEAMKLALDLKGKMRTSSKSSLEVLRFLLLLSIYGLVPFFDEEEVSKLFEFADKSSDFVQSLVKKQQHIEAVRFICAFKLADKNQPVYLLWKYMQNAKLISESNCKNTTALDIQDKARDQEIASLTNILLCISDHNLESESLINEIEDRILELNRQKSTDVYSGTWAILLMCNNLRKRNVGLKCGGRMEPSESKSTAAVSNGEDPQLQPQQQQKLSSEPSSLAHPQSSDLNHAGAEGAFGGELQNKLDLKGADEGGSETGEEVSDFNVKKPGKGEGCDEDENVNEEVGREAYGVEKNEEKSSGRTPCCPLRPVAEDCLFHMKTGTCKFGSSCKFNHSTMEKGERSSSIVCKNYERDGVCRYGNSCWFTHTRGNSSQWSMNNPATETNVDTRRQKQMSDEEEFPERPGEPECRIFLKTGDCKYKSDCKFHHPRLTPCNLS